MEKDKRASQNGKWAALGLFCFFWVVQEQTHLCGSGLLGDINLLELSVPG
jgi:hypothetical protein